MQTEQEVQDLPTGSNGEPQEEIIMETQKPEEKIIFRGREFKSQAEATAYFEKLEDDNRENEKARIEAEAYNMGIKDALSRTAPVQAAPEEEDFESQFYADPKTALEKIRQSAKGEAVAEIRQELAAERAWDQFCREYPELADSREDVVRILKENSYIAQIKDESQGRKELATKVKAYYQRITDKFAPTRELPATKGQAVSAGSGNAPSSVTQGQKNSRPLTFVEQMRKLKPSR